MFFRLDLNDIEAHNPAEILNAAPDGIALALGAPLRQPHPFGEACSRAPLRTAAIAAGLMLAPRAAGETEAAVAGRGLRTTAFSGAVAAGLEAAARRSFDLQAAHLAAVGSVEVSKLNLPQPQPAIDLSAPLESVDNGLEYKISNASLRDGENVTLTSFGRILGVSRQMVFNDDLGLLQQEVAQMGVTAARHEARSIATVLEANGNLVDGSPVFDAAFGNVSAAAFDAAGLGAAMAALRTQLAADGFALDAQAASLVVAPDLEFSARQLVYQTGLSINVLVLPGLATGRFYLIASPEVSRSIAVGRLEGQTHPLAVEGLRPPLNYDGGAIRVRFESTAVILGRLGIIRGGV